MPRVFLAVVGVLYAVFALWCTVKPATTAKAVGFTLSPGSGQSEYMVVYGGLQLALALIFLLPLARSDAVGFSLTACVLVHGSVVLFRACSFLRYAGIEKTTYVLAGLEGLILIVAAILLWRE